jgi:hypothetical protein
MRNSGKSEIELGLPARSKRRAGKSQGREQGLGPRSHAGKQAEEREKINREFRRPSRRVHAGAPEQAPQP